MSGSKKATNYYKILYQFAVFAALFYMGLRLLFDKVYVADFEAYCPFGGLQALGSYLNLNSLSCSMTTMQIMMGIMLFAGAALFSKLFCGYICPVGTLSEWLGKLGNRLKIKINVSESFDSSLRALKYMLLFVTFYFTMTSSELFCKKFDPYYAVASGFGSDVVLWYALTAIIILIAGSVLFRFFWCRYLCPFGALTNIFRYFWWFAGIAVLFLLVSLTEIEIPFIYPLLAFVCAGYILEIVQMKKVKPLLTYISRNTTTCTSCGLCSKSCPQEIDVAAMEKVAHIDCNLCGDCLYVCPEKDTLQINRRNMKWLPGAVLGLLIISGLVAGSVFELPTVNIKWGNPGQLEKAMTITVEDLNNVKCFGTSVMYSDRLKEIEGVYGVATYVGKHSAKVLYDGDRYKDETALKEMLVQLQSGVAE